MRNKNLLVFVIFITVTYRLFAVSPELKKCLPTEWKQITALTENEQQAFKQNNWSLIEEIYKKYPAENFAKNKNPFSIDNKENIKVYSEQFGTELYYWIIFNNFEENSLGMNFVRKTANGLQVLARGDYNIVVFNSKGEGYLYCQTITLIKSNKKLKAILSTTCSIDSSCDGKTLYTKCKGQYQGNCSAEFFFIKDINENDLFPANKDKLDKIRIDAAPFLWDKDNPLHYAIHNAFDGNSSTSYVENTENDLMNIEFVIPNCWKSICTSISLNNGYSLTEDIYFSNNRIKKAEFYNYRIKKYSNPWSKKIMDLQDGILDNQFFEIENAEPSNRFELEITQLYNGNLFNDTCLSEFNIKLTEKGWLFGDVNE